MGRIIRWGWIAYDVAYLVSNYRAYAQIGYAAGVALRLGVDTLISLV